MSGHSHWAGIKHKKGLTDAKKSQIFSKLAKLISIAARAGTDPNSSPKLQNIIEKARKENMPKDKIERAISKAKDKDSASLTELTVQTMSPFGVAVVITAITDNANRTINELKTIIARNGGKMAEGGSISYMFDQKMGTEGLEWIAKFTVPVADPASREKLEQFLQELDDQDDVDEIYTNLATDQ